MALPPVPTQRRIHLSPPGVGQTVLEDRDAPWEGDAGGYNASPRPHTLADAPESPRSGANRFWGIGTPSGRVMRGGVALPPFPTQRWIRRSPPSLVLTVLGDRDA